MPRAVDRLRPALARLRSALARLRPLARGMRLGWIPAALVLLAHAPARRAYAENEALHGRPQWQFLGAGLFADLLYVGPPVLLALVLPLAVAAALPARARAFAPGAARRAAVALASALLIAAWMFSVAAIESKLERGLYPTYLETKVALSSTSFVTGSLPTLLLDRYRWTSALVLAASAGLLGFYARRARRDLGTRAAVGGFALSAVLALAAGAAAVNSGHVLFPRTGGYVETRSPLETVALGRFPFPNHAAVTDGMRLLFTTRAYSRDDKRAGVRALGYPDASTDRLIAFETDAPCSAPHPLARPLDRHVPRADADPEPERRETPPGTRRDASAEVLLDDVEALSSALFAERREPIVVWQIAMESFRGDDIHALQPLAPRELTPVMTRLYDDAERTIAFRRAFQGGFRTAQNLSALQCGIGSLPFNIATARDLGHFPLRCLPDVLSDAGFATRAFYASDMAYDSMLEFFRYHGVEATQAADMPADLPMGSWRGVSDRALYDQALAHASQASAPGAAGARSQYEFVLTLSGHSPFAVPTDMPPEVAARAAEACRKSPSAKEDDCRRLAVVAYADHALGELLEKLERSPVGRRSIVVISADHATSEMFLWPGSPEEKGRSHVPYVVYVPRALTDAAPSPDAVRAIVGRLHDRAASTVISLTDSPTLVTSLLAATREMRSIPEGWRFHTFGGQATSHDFTFEARPDAVAWGTDSAAFVFSADADGSVTAYENKNRAFSEASELDALNPSLRGPAAFLASFVKGYLLRCESHARLRMTAAVR